MTNRHQIILINDCTDDEFAWLQEQVPGVAITRFADREEAKRYLAEAEVLAGFIGAKLLDEILSQDHKLRFVQAWSAGVNNYPLEQLAKEGIALSNARGVHNEQISEVIIGSMIGLVRQFPQLVRDQSQRHWGTYEELGTIHYKNVTILGAGEIGIATARLAQAFQMQVKGMKRSTGTPPYFDSIGSEDDLPELLADADFVVNILPDTPSTQHLMNHETFAYMKDGAYYINVGRGQTTDTRALLDALDSGKLAGAALDVFEEEPLPADHPLWGYPNVFIMPHVAGNDVDYNKKALRIFAENLKAYLETGKPSRNVIDAKKGY